MKLKLTDEEKESLSYSDVAYLILKDTNKKQKIQELFKKVAELLDLEDKEYENNIGDFFEQIITDKRFIMLDDGYCDLKINHSARVIVEEDDEDYEIVPEDESFDDEVEEDNYDEDASADDDTDDDLQDLVILDDSEELEDSDI